MFQNMSGVWDGLDECEISRPEILFQSTPGSYAYSGELNISVVFLFFI